MTRYPTLPDDQITDWYAGASLNAEAGTPLDSIDGWEAADAIVTFSDIGYGGDGPSHGQIVIYTVDHRADAVVAASAEIDPRDARKIAKRLLAWAKEAEEAARP